MAIETVKRIVLDTFAAPGAIHILDFPFDFDNDLIVTVFPEDSNVGVVSDAADYTVTIYGDYAGGEVSWISDPEINSVIQIKRLVTATQSIDWTGVKSLKSPIVEKQMDRLTMAIIDNAGEAFAAMRKAGTGLSFDVEGLLLSHVAEGMADDDVLTKAQIVALVAVGQEGPEGPEGPQGPAGDGVGDFLKSGSEAMTGNLQMGGNNLVGVGLVDGRDVLADGTFLDLLDDELATIELPAGTTISDFGKSLIGTADADAAQTLLEIEEGATDTWNNKAIGEAFPLWDHITGVAVPPTDQSYRFVLLSYGESGSGEYNEGVVTNETTEGSSPTIDAFFDIDLTGSPVNGQTFRLINTTREFPRPGETAGILQESQNKAHTHGYVSASGTTSADGFGANGSSATNTNSSGGDEARPRNISARYYMRIL